MGTRHTGHRMTADELISEGRRLQRPTTLLMEVAGRRRSGDLAPPQPRADTESKIGHGLQRKRMKWDIPQCDISLAPWLSIFTHAVRPGAAGRVETSAQWHPHGGRCTALSRVASSHSNSLSIDRSYRIGRPPAVGEDGLPQTTWRRDWRYNRNFKDRAIVEKYEAVQWQEHSLYLMVLMPTLGGWHRTRLDADRGLARFAFDAKLVLRSNLWLMDSEPWVELLARLPRSPGSC